MASLAYQRGFKAWATGHVGIDRNPFSMTRQAGQFFDWLDGYLDAANGKTLVA